MTPLNKKRLFRGFILPLSLGTILLSCAKKDDLVLSPSNQEQVETYLPTRLSENQALAYARLFGTYAENAGKPKNEARSLSNPNTISDISYCIEGKDTLMYSVNFVDNSGFMLISADNSKFPIIAHADKGRLDFSNISKSNPLYDIIEAEKSVIKYNLQAPNRVLTDYYQKWKDIGNKDFSYEIEPIATPPQGELRGRRDYSSEKATIYPSTGKRLNQWCQAGNFNKYSEGGIQYKIGCPALAIGMLLYDCGNRPDGARIVTNPRVPFYLSDANPNNDYASEVSQILRQIADSIPDYRWGIKGSGAKTEDIKIGLQHLGFTQAKCIDFNIDTLYKHLSFQYKDIFNDEQTGHRGVLIRANSIYATDGHIWFCDGYYEQSYRLTKKFLSFTVKSWNEYDDRLYMNFGLTDANNPQQSIGSGWFAADEYIWTSRDESVRQQGVLFNLWPEIFINLGIYNKP